MTDLYEHLMAGSGVDERRALDMSLQGYLMAEIAWEIGVSERTILRFRKSFRRRLESIGILWKSKGLSCRI